MAAYTICIANQKGGVGKTTASIEIAAALIKRERKVLVIDFDQQCNLTKYVGADLEYPTIFQVLDKRCNIRDAIQHTEEGFDVISSSDELSTADKHFPDITEVFLLSQCIKEIENDYDYVVVDNSPSRNILLQMSYVAADGIIMPVESDIGSIDGISAIYSDVEKFRGSYNLTHAEFLGFIANKYEKTSIYKIALENLDEMRNKINPDAFIVTVRKAAVASEAKTMTKSMQHYRHSSTTATDFRNVANEIIKKVEE